jgi:hypothetical protein
VSDCQERESTKMIRVTVEIREGALKYRALKIAGGGKRGRRVRLVFPIEPESFFPAEVPGRKEAA